MQGNLILNANPTANLGAATKQYVDSEIGNLQKRYKLFSKTKTYNKFTSGSPVVDKIFTLPDTTYQSLGFLPTKLYVEAEATNYSASNALSLNISETGFAKQIVILSFPRTNTDDISLSSIKLSMLLYLNVQTGSVAVNDRVSISTVYSIMPDNESPFYFDGKYGFFLYHHNVNGTVKVDAWLS